MNNPARTFNDFGPDRFHLGLEDSCSKACGTCRFLRLSNWAQKEIGQLRRIRRPVPLRHESTPFDSASFAECQPDHRNVEKALPAPVGAGQPRQKAS